MMSQDLLRIAAYGLQSRMYGFVQFGLLRYTEDETKKDVIYMYTDFLVGQYLSWVYILHRQAQFLCFSTNKTSTMLNKILDTISSEFSKDRSEEAPFRL